MSVRQIHDQVDTCECWMDSFDVGAYIWKVCTQHMCLHVPVPLSPLHQHPLLLLAEAGFSEPGNTTDLQYCTTLIGKPHLEIVFEVSYQQKGKL